ncbi:Uncharacterised protein [Klebsiella pneumoniae]|nr:Uncharacterised protein [Klebsiella pneumoniae]SLY03855.1 Uncharacterised protein [Klebsiella pneumoniae]VGC49809.1 Uncharacterised protein [Klebsiella pneumoniae]VGI94339.1 Uncharacterised protein [Klebsiella pneumoniae]
MAVRRRSFGIVQPFAPGDLQLGDDKVNASGFFRHSVFNLQAGIDLKEGELPFRAKQKLDGTSAAVRCFATQLSGCIMNTLTLFITEKRRGRFFNQLLVTAL